MQKSLKMLIWMHKVKQNVKKKKFLITEKILGSKVLILLGIDLIGLLLLTFGTTSSRHIIDINLYALLYNKYNI